MDELSVRISALNKVKDSMEKIHLTDAEKEALNRIRGRLYYYQQKARHSQDKSLNTKIAKEPKPPAPPTTQLIKQKTTLTFN